MPDSGDSQVTTDIHDQPLNLRKLRLQCQHYRIHDSTLRNGVQSQWLLSATNQSSLFRLHPPVPLRSHGNQLLQFRHRWFNTFNGRLLPATTDDFHRRIEGPVRHPSPLFTPLQQTQQFRRNHHRLVCCQGSKPGKLAVCLIAAEDCRQPVNFLKSSLFCLLRCVLIRTGHSQLQSRPQHLLVRKQKVVRCHRFAAQPDCDEGRQQPVT